MMKKAYHLKALQTHELLPGFHGKFIHSKHLTTVYWDVRAGSMLPEHDHLHEQVTNILEGQFEFTCEGETNVYSAGDIIIFPSYVKHAGRAVTDCKILDIFSPAREDYQ